jgi:23S rRNA pseudouridine1911/1915/1917 synthase
LLVAALPNSTTYTGVVSGLSSPVRLDRYLAETLALMSRSQLKARTLTALVNGKAARLSRPVKSGDTLSLCWTEPVSALLAEDIPLDILYENDNVVVVNKPQGMVVHPAAGNHTGTLANALLWRVGGSISAFPAMRPFIVHRLDKDTSGVIIAAKNCETLAFLQEQFRERRVKKVYYAVCMGVPREASGVLDTQLTRDPHDRKRFTTALSGGKRAITIYRVVQAWRFRGREYALVRLRPRTGRTHQLRVHLRSLSCPILGDPLYGMQDTHFSQARLMLHARRLEIALAPGGVPSVFVAPLPERWRVVLRILTKGGV